MGDDASLARSLIEDIFSTGLTAVEPQSAVQRSLTWREGTLFVAGEGMPIAGRVAVLAVGKAAQQMARGASDVLGAAISEGIILTKSGYLSDDVPGFRSFEASHPVPDERGVAASEAILDLARSRGSGDLLLALISGGGSALLEAPRPPVILADLQRTTELLLRAGAPIQHLNAVRSELSLVKGGGLRRAAGAATCVSLILSDVLGNEPGVIASGPTVIRQPAPAEALHVLDRYGLRDRVPASVLRCLDERISAPERSEALPASAQDKWVVIGDNDALLDAASTHANDRCLRPHVLWRGKEGEARELAREWVECCAQCDAAVNVVLGGGEATVTVRGDGRGGRNTEFALAAAAELAARRLDWTVASLASDGDDGAASAAGAVVDGTTIEHLRSYGIDPADVLQRNDSATALDAIGALVRTGPTGTNVNDLYVAVRAGAVAKREQDV
jgi:hydroxypyruvate reductase